MSRIKGANVLVTGGANGIGKLMGESCLLEGAAHLVIWDINDANLKNTIVEFSKKGFKNVTPYLVDVSDIDDIEKTATKVLLDVGNIDILFNNAGIVAGSKRFWEHTRNDIEKTMAINSNGVMHVARVFLPDMLKQGHGHVVNIASIAGIITNVNMAVYVASKWACIGFSESLRLELEQEKGEFHVTTVTPSYIDTGMFKGVSAPLLFPLVKPEEMVKQIIDGVKKDKVFVRAPDMVNVVPFLKGVLPTRAFDFVANILGVTKSMDTFKGRPKEEMMPEKSIKKVK
ncbi:MAG: SDR family NAD(P)-dependent oxidoreductase [Bacteroidetes bacterium]|jgi:all-trans-retinol dehydrogenase (NAD+)|nr:SDR family NAD(P)-dependent oxidoreductase [Bacteroidota bacterium]MBK7638864.1 SDR family NAD(P)-dependent oxidoreductase [Bacteroidota bacterium]MBK8672676.1 SDR family NAD(P)-dependent oxidoreductase [Bacteroidota bacterium]MBK9636163.1 SDR family NAD(P)-dependent oxidoreductase [Bacteroidota bacterium]